MATNAPSTVRARRLRERRSRGVAMVAPVEVGEGGIDLLIRNELLKRIKRVTGKPSVRRVSRRWSSGPWAGVRGLWDRVRAL